MRIGVGAFVFVSVGAGWVVCGFAMIDMVWKSMCHNPRSRELYRAMPDSNVMRDTMMQGSERFSNSCCRPAPRVEQS
jgi:hypothetical protein